MNPRDLWIFLPVGYLLTIAIETPIVLLGLSPRHGWRRRLFAGFWLTACTYPVVVLVLPSLLAPNRTTYLIVAETFAPVAECVLFWWAFGERAQLGRRSMWWDFSAITLANITSFAIGEVMNERGLWDWVTR